MRVDNTLFVLLSSILFCSLTEFPILVLDNIPKWRVVITQIVAILSHRLSFLAFRIFKR